jgi:FtsP/CotA-like multicopper oxidase with cupredoxin domain
VLAGDPASVVPLASTWLGPLIRARRGQKVRVHFRNELPEPSIVHWHGLLVPSRMDGHPRDAVPPGASYVYEFEIANRAGTYWFHPHPEPLTGSQVIKGLAGLFVVSDDEEEAVGLPSGAQDVPLVIQDRTFDANNQIVYVQGGEMAAMPGMASMEMLMGFLGDRILVNGAPNAALPVATRAYRLRLLNGSNSRVYKLAWSDATSLTVIATDGGLLDRPVARPFVMLGPGERVELWADFSTYAVGDEVTLQSLAFVGAEGDSLLEPMDDMEAMDGYAPALPNGSAFPVLHVHVERAETETLVLPERLAPIERLQLANAVNAGSPRRFELTMQQSSWRINGRLFEMEAVAQDETVGLGTVEAWDFVNMQNPAEPMERAGMVHPMHIHGVQFQVIERDPYVPELRAGWDSVYEGYVDEGWKDTVLVMPGERLRLLMRFDFPDLFLFHCHNLEHEDLGMMRNFRVDA